MKYILGYLKLLFILFFLCFPFLVVLSIGLVQIDNLWWLLVFGIIYSIFIFIFGRMIYEYLPSKKFLIYVPMPFALFFYVLFIGIFAIAYSNFFIANVWKEYIVSIILLLFSIFFLLLAYQSYFKGKSEKEISYDFLFSLSASLILGTVNTLLNSNNLPFNSICFLIASTLFFFIGSIFVYLRRNT